jgi:hypothetical protein
MQLSRIAPFPLLIALACPTDPGDVGSESVSNSGSAEGDEAADDDVGDDVADDGDDDDGGTSNSASSTGGDDGASSDGDEGSSAVTLTDDGAPQTESTGGSSGDDGSSESGTMVTDCSECGPDEGCMVEVSKMIQYFCVPIPADCGIEFTCDCASDDYCLDPFSFCVDPPDPPQRQINCECINC